MMQSPGKTDIHHHDDVILLIIIGPRDNVAAGDLHPRHAGVIKHDAKERLPSPGEAGTKLLTTGTHASYN
jgi:hypothetical protein